MRRIEPYCPLSHDAPRVDDRQIVSGITFVIKNGLRWRNALKEYGPHKKIYNRFIPWNRLGDFKPYFQLWEHRQLQLYRKHPVILPIHTMSTIVASTECTN